MQVPVNVMNLSLLATPRRNRRFLSCSSENDRSLVKSKIGVHHSLRRRSVPRKWLSMSLKGRHGRQLRLTDDSD